MLGYQSALNFGEIAAMVGRTIDARRQHSGLKSQSVSKREV